MRHEQHVVSVFLVVGNMFVSFFGGGKQFHVVEDDKLLSILGKVFCSILIDDLGDQRSRD